MVAEKFSFQNLKFYKECMAHKLFATSINFSQFLMVDIFFNIDCKKLTLLNQSIKLCLMRVTRYSGKKH